MYSTLLTLGAHAQRGLVCVSVCLSHISPMERLFVLKTLSRTQRATEVEKFVGICLKLLRSRVMPRNMSEEANMRLTRGQLSPLNTQRSARWVLHNDCQQRSVLPKRCLLMPLARVGAINDSTTLQREAWPISHARALA